MLIARWLFTIALTAAWCFMLAGPSCGQASRHNVRDGQLHVAPGWSQSSIHNPSSPRYIDMRPGGMARKGIEVPVARIPQWPWGATHAPWHYGRHPHWRYRNYYPPLVLGDQAGVLTSFYQNRYYYNGWYGNYYDAPFYDYGPGVYYSVDPQAVAAPPRDTSAKNVPGTVADLPRSSPDRRQLALRFVEFGDRQFAKGEYVQAQANYRKAIQAAGDLSEPYFHRAQAYIGQGRYDQAKQALKQAIELDPELKGAENLFTMYDGNAEAHHEHVEKLLAAVKAKPGNGDQAIAAGWQLLLLGHREDAHALFLGAARLDGYGSMLATLTELSAPLDYADTSDEPAAPVTARPQPATPDAPLRANFPGAQPENRALDDEI